MTFFIGIERILDHLDQQFAVALGDRAQSVAEFRGVTGGKLKRAA
jgi:hypothetical protein